MANHSDRPEIVQAYNGKVGRSMRYSDTVKRQMMYVARPLRSPSGDIVGVVRTSLPVTALEQSFAMLRGRLLVSLLWVLLAAVLIGLGVSRYIIAPIEDLRRGVDRLARGDLRFRLPSPRTEEMAALADAVRRMASDLHERIREAVRQRNARDAVFAAMQEAVIAIDADQCAIFANPAAGRLFEFDPAACAGKAIHEFVRNADLDALIDTAMATQGRETCDIVLRSPEERTLETHVSPLRDADHRNMGLVVVFNDVTQLRRTDKVRRDFVANVSHELRTPVTAIRGFAETLDEESEDDVEVRRRFLRIIAEHAQRIERIITDLLCLARMEGNAVEPPAEAEDRPLYDLSKRAVEACRPRAEEKGLALNLSGHREVSARVHDSLLEQAVRNLVENAITYSDPNQSIDIVIESQDGKPAIAVSDHGCGIAETHLPRIFERFYRVDKGRSRGSGGTGLGLSIVRHVVLMHGGEVKVDSVLGQGSTFTIILPASS